MPFRVTESSAKLLCAAVGAAALVCLSGCGQDGGPAAPTTHSDPAEAVPGIAATQPTQIPPDAAACTPTSAENGVATTATVSDPTAPRITINVPSGWSSAAGTGDTALTLSGPDQMSATVTIAATDLPPDSAFLRYTAGVGGSMKRLKFSVTGVPFCGYSSEQLTGTLQGPSGEIDFADRITHIWTNTKNYLVAIHLEGRSGIRGWSATKSALTQDFAVVIP